MFAIRFHTFGDPLVVLKVEELPMPAPADDEVLVRLTARSVNPSDLYTVMGTYGILPRLPATPGNEGAGVVEAVGAAVERFKPGDRVTLLLGAAGNNGTWMEYLAVKADWLIHTPEGLSDAQAACTWVNYLTALIMTEELLALQPGEVVLATAGASHLGRALLQLARHRGFKVVPVVRRAEQKQELLDMGALDVIATDSEEIGPRWNEITGQKGIGKALEAVGGAIGSAVAEALAPGGTMIIYGLMSQEPWTISGKIVFTEATIRGFWLMPWLRKSPPEHVARLMKTLTDLFADGTLDPQIDRSFDLRDVEAMVQRSLEPGRQGKVIITGPAEEPERT